MVGYGYANGNLTALTTPSGQTVTYGFNSNHQVISIAINSNTLLNTVTYEPFGAVKGWTWGNSSTSSRSYNTDGRISQIANLETTNYTYDYAGRITAIANTANSALSWSYGYDVLDRLNSASVSGASYGWTYDSNGNRTSQTGTTPWTLSIASTSNRLSSTSGTESRSYSYDSAGNTLSYNTITNTYNNRGRMKTADVSSATTTYVTNAMGQRAKKSGGNATTTYYIYDEAGHLIGEYDSSGALVQETVYLGDTPVATIRPNGGSVDVFYVHADHLNTPKKVSRSSDNQLRWRWDQDPFGTAVPSQNPASLGTFVYNLRFPGQVYDSETGLNYNYFRDYDPQVGRYVESDPIGLYGGINGFAYVLGNPIGNADSQGLFIDTLLDLASLGYDVYRLIRDNAVNDCGNLDTNLSALGADLAATFIPGVTGAGIGVRAARAVKAVNLPAWKKVGIDMGHVLERHTAQGALAAGRTTFPELMNAKGIERAVREAYRYGEKIGSQGDRVLMQGTSGGMTIEMWVNRATGMIETAYPVVR